MTVKTKLLSPAQQTFVSSGVLFSLYLVACAIANDAYAMAVAMLCFSLTGLYALTRPPSPATVRAECPSVHRGR